MRRVIIGISSKEPSSNESLASTIFQIPLPESSFTSNNPVNLLHKSGRIRLPFFIPPTTIDTRISDIGSDRSRSSSSIRSSSISSSISSSNIGLHKTIQLLRGGDADVSTTPTNEMTLPDLNDLENDDFLDAFVEELIANVDDDDDNDEDEDEVGVVDGDDDEEKENNCNVATAIVNDDNVHNHDDDDDNDNDMFINENEDDCDTNIVNALKEQNKDKVEMKEIDTIHIQQQQQEEENLIASQLKSSSQLSTSSTSTSKKKKKKKHSKKRKRVLSKDVQSPDEEGGESNLSSSSSSPLSSSSTSLSKSNTYNTTTITNSHTNKTISNTKKESHVPTEPRVDIEKGLKDKISKPSIHNTIQPPNPIQKFLLHKGKIGRSITTFSILFHEFLSYYVPIELQSLFIFLLQKTIPHSIRRHFDSESYSHSTNSGTDGSGRRLKRKNNDKKLRASIPAVNSIYSTFVSSNRSIGGQKLDKQQRQTLDAIALDKLKRIHSGRDGASPGANTPQQGVRGISSSDRNGIGIGIGEFNEGGIYTHLSLRFMKKYNLGHFENEKKMFDDMIGVLGNDGNENVIDEDMDLNYNDNGNYIVGDKDNTALENKEIISKRKATIMQHDDVYHDNDGDDDNDWVAQAFLLDMNNEEDNDIIGSTIDDYYGNDEKNYGMRKNLDIIEAAYASNNEITSFSSKSKKIKTRRTVQKNEFDMNDKDRSADNAGASNSNNMFDRLRAAAETNGVTSRRIFGAYPGDAAAIEDAASANGVVELATKYGYGDWSDDSDELDFSHGKIHKGRRKRIKKKRELDSLPLDWGVHRSTSRQMTDGLSFSMEFGNSSSSKRIRRRKRKIKSSSTRAGTSKANLNTEENLVGITSRRKRNPSSAVDSCVDMSDDSLASKQRKILRSGLESRLESDAFERKRKRRRKQDHT